MTVSSVTSAGNTAVQAPKTDAEKATLSYDAFLKLMLEQLKKQDPTDPVDQAQSLAQLASFSTVEQTIKLNDKLTSLLQMQGASQSVNLIGKTVTSLKTNASGIVKAVEVNSEGTFAVLANGTKLAVSEGLRIS